LQLIYIIIKKILKLFNNLKLQYRAARSFVTKNDNQRIWLGLAIVLVGIILPKYIQIYQFHVINHLNESISRQDSGLLIIASAKLVLLNTIRHVPIYTGAYVLGEGLNKKISKFHLGFIISLGLIPLTYSLIGVIYNICLVFGGSCFLTILTFFFVHRTTQRINPIFIKVIINNLFLFGMDWLDIVPALSKYGFGKGEVAIIIKQVSEFISATYVMNFIGIIFTLIIIFTALILLKVVIDNYNRLLLVEENKQKEESLRRYQVEAIKSRYFLEIKHLVHDLKTPLVTIQGLGEVIKLKTRNQKILEYTERIINSAEKMSEMISEILNETKMDIINMKELFDFIKIQLSLNEVISKIKFEILPDLEIYGNKVRLSRAIINLIENSFKAINSENGRILVKAWKVENKAIILVEDNGIGISEDAIERVWDAGYTTNLEHTGLGLNFVKEVLTSHHGEIMIESKVNVGTRVIISLPLVTERCPKGNNPSK